MTSQGKKKERKANALAKIESEKNALRVSNLATEYFERQILGRWKHPDILRRRIDKDINPNIGYLKVDEVKPRHIDDMLQNILTRGAPTVANDVLRWTRRIFNYGIKCHALETNPTTAFDLSDAGGQWREAFLKMRGQVSDEMKAQQLQRLANQEMSRELGHLLLSLDIEKDRQEITCSGYGKALLDSHKNALMAYAEQELKKALSAGLETLIRPVSLKCTALKYQQATVTLGGRLSDYEVSPDAVIFEEINQYLKDEMTRYKFDLAHEPVLAQLGVHPPETKFFSAELATSGGRSMTFSALKRKEEQLGATAP